jgi:hypothetical protein
VSYSIDLNTPPCGTCGHQPPGPSLPEPTYNLTPVFDLALTGEDPPNPEVSEFASVVLHRQTDRPRGLRLLDGRRAGDPVEWLEKAVRRMPPPENRERFLAPEPANGWGDLPGAVTVVTRLLEAARECPDGTWSVC